MKKFVFSLYSCDPVPLEHLQSKLKYLFKGPSQILIIFVKNFAPEENYFGEGMFRHIQCSYIKRLKEDIRNKFNPRINGNRTEEHVIHASDYEEQVDYLLKMLGNREGIKLFHDNGAYFPFKKPYHIRQPLEYIFKSLPIRVLRASIIISATSKDVECSLMEIDKTPHFRSLYYGTTDYEDYYKKYRYKLLLSDHYSKKFMQLSRLNKTEIKNLDPILVMPLKENVYQILDGVHRAAVALFNGLDHLRCVEFR